MEESNKMLDGIIAEMNMKMTDLKVAMRDITSQQSELDIRRSRIEGQIYEIEWSIGRVIDKVEDENEVKPLVVASGGS